MTRKWLVNRFDSRARVLANYGSALQAQVTPYMDGVFEIVLNLALLQRFFQQGCSAQAAFQFHKLGHHRHKLACHLRGQS
jgi:hypothetical protein